jgi:hypothetical protein
MSNEDRCTNGFVYDPNLKACGAIPDASLAQPDVAPTPGGPNDAAVIPEDATSIAEAGGAVSEAAPVGPEVPATSGATFGTPCAAATECTSSTASYCLKMPGSTAGYCSKLNCAADCPTDFRCCNCPAFGVVACMKSTDAIKAAAVGCTCS